MDYASSLVVVIIAAYDEWDESTDWEAASASYNTYSLQSKK